MGRTSVRSCELTGGFTVRQIVIDGGPIGGYLELAALARSGELSAAAA